ncbi:MAG: DUF1016 N-terminal domain-containing protein [Candidatus Omnitrophota bacterium]
MADFDHLAQDIAVILAESRQNAALKVVHCIIAGYWRIGKRIAAEPLSPSDLPEALTALAQKTGIDQTNLSRARKFYLAWPDSPPTAEYPRLTWSHYKILLGIPDEQTRGQYLRAAHQGSWPVRELSQKIKSRTLEMLTEAENQTGPGRTARLTRRPESLHIYKARLERVVDGDTLLIHIDLGFDVWVEKRLRLRGINAPELTAADNGEKKLAQAAKSFVERALAENSALVIQTFQVDLHGRFVADVFYLPGETDKEKIYQKGIFLNQQLLDHGLAKLF